MENRVNFIGIPLDNLSISETLNRIENSIFHNKQIHHCVINAGKVVKMQSDKKLQKSVISSDIINADGMSVVWAARLMGLKIKERVAGIDLMDKLVGLAHNKNYKCFFLGAKEQVVKKVVDHYSDKYSNQVIAGYRNGYFDFEEEKIIIDQIIKSKANLLFVAITSPKKEIFINKHKDQLKSVNLIMGVGGSFDVISGEVKRAPLFMQKIGLEWFFRFVQEPRRMWKRYLIGNLKFVIIVFREFIHRLLTNFSNK
ncbi:MAG: glycosyltransferase [Flavobacteriales bacterium]|nr:glycosyltransferase [Flavobacteriales bacterium]|tara:strand:- start:1012 stop:1776 length:765 start_codon:yes stop_codon:yes gene_type:complete